MGEIVETQDEISAEIEAMTDAYAKAGEVETQPRLDYPPYRSSLLRHPTKAPEPVERPGPAARARLVATYDHDVTQPEWCTATVGTSC